MAVIENSHDYWARMTNTHDPITYIIWPAVVIVGIAILSGIIYGVIRLFDLIDTTCVKSKSKVKAFFSKRKREREARSLQRRAARDIELGVLPSSAASMPVAPELLYAAPETARKSPQELRRKMFDRSRIFGSIPSTQHGHQQHHVTTKGFKPRHPSVHTGRKFFTMRTHTTQAYGNTVLPLAMQTISEERREDEGRYSFESPYAKETLPRDFV